MFCLQLRVPILLVLKMLSLLIFESIDFDGKFHS